MILNAKVFKIDKPFVILYASHQYAKTFAKNLVFLNARPNVSLWIVKSFVLTHNANLRNVLNVKQFARILFVQTIAA